jgi:predicted MFS family arabinose efflux permease
MLPSAVLAPVLSPYADRWPRERLLVVVSAVPLVAAVLLSTSGV